MSSLTTGALVSRTATRPASVLVVDHSQADRQQICRQLRMIYGPLVKIREAAAACQAFELLEQAGSDLVLVEYQLPDIDGLDVISQLLEGKEHGAIILMTTQGSDRLAAEALRQGASDYLVKGDVGPAELEQMITFALRTARVEERNGRSIQQLRDAHQHMAKFLGNLSSQLDAHLMVLERSLKGLQQGADRPALGRDLAALRASLLQTQQSLGDVLVLTHAGQR